MRLRYLMVIRNMSVQVSGNEIILPEIDDPLVFNSKQAAIDFCHENLKNSSEYPDHVYDEFLEEITEHGYWVNDESEYILFQIPDMTEDGYRLEEASN